MPAYQKRERQRSKSQSDKFTFNCGHCGVDRNIKHDCVSDLYSQGLSKKDDEKLLWKGSSQAGLSSFIETHLKQSIDRAVKSGCERDDEREILPTDFYSCLSGGFHSCKFFFSSWNMFEITVESECLEKSFIFRIKFMEFCKIG
jgi:hypothetical protein